MVYINADADIADDICHCPPIDPGMHPITSITIINQSLHQKDDQKTKKIDPGTQIKPRYAPHGKRSWGPTRALIGEATTQQANDYVKVGMRNTYFYFMTIYFQKLTNKN